MNEVLLIGVGHPDRGDDAIGPLLVRALGASCPAGVRPLEAGGDLLALLDRWASARAAVLVDATCGGGAPGAIVRIAPQAGSACPWPTPSFSSSHAIDLAGALELGRALGKLPRELVIYGVEGARFGLGEPLSAAVAAALPSLLAQVAAELARLTMPTRTETADEEEPPSGSTGADAR